MKILVAYLSLTSIFFGSAYAQSITTADSTGLPGDNFSLQGALEMFKKAESTEEFEKLLNTEDNKVNNLDLNEDGEIDYIKVIDNSEKDAHAFVLQAAISETENQDIAVIELEKTADDKAVVQVVGDEDIYGEPIIVEPKDEIKANAGTSTSTVVVNVRQWPNVRYVYGPSYRAWVSPWGWRSRPVGWHPWRPVRYHVFHPYRSTYYNRYAVVHTHRVVHAHRIYTPVRTTSVSVRTKHQSSVNHYRTTRTIKKQTVTKSPNNHRVAPNTKVKSKSGAKRISGSKTTVQKKKN